MLAARRADEEPS